jgi:hypothetical protein
MQASTLEGLIERAEHVAETWERGRYGDKTLRLRAELTAQTLRELVAALREPCLGPSGTTGPADAPAAYEHILGPEGAAPTSPPQPGKEETHMSHGSTVPGNALRSSPTDPANELQALKDFIESALCQSCGGRGWREGQHTDDSPRVECDDCDGTGHDSLQAFAEVQRIKAAMNRLGDELRMVSVRLSNATIGAGDIQRLLRAQESQPAQVAQPSNHPAFMAGPADAPKEDTQKMSDCNGNSGPKSLGDGAPIVPFRQRDEHRCSGCGHRWEGSPPVKLCGDCWRSGQSVIFAANAGQPDCANCGCPALHHPTSNAGIPLGRACSCGSCPVYVGKDGDRVGLAVASAQAERQSIARGDKDSTRSDEATSESESISGGAAPTSTPLDALRAERLDDLRTIAAFAMAQGEDDVENAGIRVMLALDHPDLLAASPASSQPTSTPLDAVKEAAFCIVEARQRLVCCYDSRLTTEDWAAIDEPLGKAWELLAASQASALVAPRKENT